MRSRRWSRDILPTITPVLDDVTTERTDAVMNATSTTTRGGAGRDERIRGHERRGGTHRRAGRGRAERVRAAVEAFA